MLVSPSHGGNVGATARAMRVMGLRSLTVVRPRFAGICSHPDAVAFASGATDVLAGAIEVDTLDDALADCHLAVAVSAETRDDPALQAALVFGPERTGLSVAHVQRCSVVVSIPGEPGYSSLNLAQAVQVLCWELRRAALAGVVPPQPAEPGAGPPATHQQIEQFHAHFEEALVAVGFLDPLAPKKLVPRMRRLFARAGLRVEEVELLRGVCKQMLLAARGALPGRSRRDPE
ncbi:MAG: RNA methyltransferase [Burkholderiales bacterium]|nr:RNA methyltransferase [Burkholderiales bacterium]